MIPLSVPNLSGNEWKYIKECLDTNWVSAVGSYVDDFEKKFATFTQSRYAVSVVNGTAALHISLLLAGVERGDLVIVPNITFVASCNAISYVGAEPLLIDVDPLTWQMDLSLLESFLKEKTVQKNGQLYHKESQRRIKAIMPVHVLGNMCDMDQVIKLASDYLLEVVEDSTEALGSYYKNKHAGTFGKLGCFSFNGNKIITTGGGGMIVTDDEKLAKKAKHITTQAKSKSDEYFHDEIGYNYRLVNILAAMGVAQLEQLSGFLERKKQVTDFYNNQLKKIKGIQFQQISPNVEPNNWLYTVMIPEQKKLIAYLNQSAIQVRPFWVPMNQLPMFKKNIYITTHDKSDEIYHRSISLPCSTSISDQELEQVVSKIIEFDHVNS